jgi:hypothetical protein
MLTNEERRVGIYTESHQPIDPAQVSPNTPLEALNLNWRERDLPERVRTKHVHRLHPYLGKFIPQLAEVFLRKFFRAEQTVLDPFRWVGHDSGAGERVRDTRRRLRCIGVQCDPLSREDARLQCGTGAS